MAASLMFDRTLTLADEFTRKPAGCQMLKTRRYVRIALFCKC